ncbi:hypothetical protein T190115A13A_330001 [Tenacibaculum sp. 190524A02b]|uniref:Carrier domain-containing protein n=1 Tax=Tenacibaculum vairaonense TaxID=3137860 RepID=A0ABP1F9V7_9FLAO
MLSFTDKEKQVDFIKALQFVVNRHDVLRTCVISEDLPRAVQVVLREAPLSVEELVLDSSLDILSELKALASSESQWMDVSKAPLLTLKSIDDLKNGTYYLIINQHHLVLDHVGLEKVVSEVEQYLSGKGSFLPTPALYRDFIGHTLHLQETNDSASYFKKLLGTVDEPTYPFELSDVRGNGSEIKESNIVLAKDLSKKIREVSTNLGISPAVLFHAAYGIVISKSSNRDYALFGSLFSGRLQGSLGAADSLGLFINTLPFYIELKGDVSEYVANVKNGLQELLSYEQSSLSDIKGWSSISNEIPLFSALLNFRHSSIPENSEENTVDLGITIIEDRERTNYPFAVNVDDYGVDFGLTAQIDDSIDVNKVLTYMQKALQELLRGLQSEEKIPVTALTILSEQEETQLLKDFNDTEVEYPLNQTVLDLFEEQVKNKPEAIALVYKEEKLSYKELDQRSNQLAQYLIEQGVKTNLVGLCLDRSLEMLIGIIGILKSGSAYVPIDPNYPKERIDYMLNDANINLVLTSNKVSQEVLGNREEITVISLDTDWDTISSFSTTKIEKIPSNNLAYVIYTSGSTGKPKGVPIRHKSLINYITTSSNTYIGEGISGGYMHLSMSFDASMTEIFTPLVNGKHLVISSGEGLDIFKDENLWKYAPYDFIKLTPSHLELLSSVLEQSSGTLSYRYVLGGESLQPNHLSIFKDLNISATIINEYGPTEATVGCTVNIFNTLEDHSSITNFPIGIPMSNMSIYILDSYNQLVPKGVVGELCIGGVGLSPGYLNREELTKEKFIDNPFKIGEKIYKTGDLGRWLSEGNIEFVGRKDDQVKIRGYRIELGEIENALSNLETIHQSCVLAKEDANGNKRLVGYVVVEDSFDKETVQSQLKEVLPDYMVPNLWVDLEVMPLTNNGKLDRKSLPDPDSSMLSTKEYVAPRNETEEQLVIIWQELLGIEQIGVYDSFFELGGHSLLATRLVSMIRKRLQIEITIREVFEYITISDLGLQILTQSKRVLLPSVVVENRPKHTPLSFSQERLWFLDQLQGSSQEYHIPTVIRLEGTLNVVLLEEALKTIVARHEILHTVIYEEEGVGYQKIISPNNWSLNKTIITEHTHLEKEIGSFISLPFDLSKDYMLRSCLYDLGNEKYVLACIFHHIASDGWSGNILTSEFIELYSALQSGRETMLPELNLQYVDYAIWQRKYLEGDILENQLTYWKEKLTGVSTLSLPLDYARPSIQSNEGANISISLDKELSLSLKALCQEEGVTVFMFMLSVFKVLLARYSNQEDVCVGTPIANRTQSELEGMIGFFVNTLALRSDLSGNPSFKEVLKRVKETTLEGYDYQLTPFEKVVDKVVTTRDMSMTPLFQVMFDYHNETSVIEGSRKGKNEEIKDLDISGYEYSEIPAQFDLTLDVSEGETVITLGLNYCTALFKEDTIVRMLKHYKELLLSIVKDTEKSIGDLSMLTQEEETELLEFFNENKVDYPLEKTVVDLFVAQVQKSPKAVAATFKGEELTYKELDERSNQLAHYLVEQGVQADDLVGICIDRGLDMLIGIVAILKSGGAYVPIKPDFPEDRIAYLLEDTGCSLLVTNTTSKEVLSSLIDSLSLIVLDDISVLNHPTTSLELSYSPNNLAYVIYTSGSTGLPKGAMIEHAGLLNHSLIMIDELKMTNESVVAFTAPFTFDISVWQLLSGLLCGGRIAIYSEDEILDLEVFQSSLSENNISHLQLVPSYVASLLESGEEVVGLSNLAYFLVTGEAATKSLLDKWFSLYPSVPVVNAYGPAEAADDITLHIMNESPSGVVVPIGKPVANMDLYVVDKFDNLCPIGVVGELWTSGIGVGRGYLNREELTKEKFITNPFTSEGGRLYKTGDLGRWLPDGNIEFVGRSDDQVKIRGYRIELGEIENALSIVEGVQNSCVLAKQDTIGTNRLVGYIVLEDGFSKANIQEALKTSLPDYMVPSIWVELDEMPLTANGKIDRKSLPEPDLSELSSREYVAPRNEVEEQLAIIWQDLLGVEKVGIYDDFFELGGHSLLATRLVSTIRRILKVEVSIRNIFQFTTIGSLAAHVSLQSKEILLPAITVEEFDGCIPLSFSQERLWFLDQLQGTLAYHMPIVISLEGALNTKALEDSFKTIIARHEVLRTNILLEEGLGYQEIVNVDNWSLAQETISESKLEESLDSYLTTPFDLSNDYKLRVCLYNLGNEKYVLACVFHHIASDGWSENILISEFLELYSSLQSGKQANLQALNLQYSDYAIWQRKYLNDEFLNTQLSYWEKKLGGTSTLELPLDYTRPAIQSMEGASTFLDLDENLTTSVKKLCKEEGVTPFMFLLTVFKVLLSRYSGQKDICVGTPIANRTQSDLEGMIGFFVNTLALRSDLSGNPNFRDLLNQVKQTTLEGYDHQLVPFERIVDRVVTTRDMSMTPLFQVMFTLQNTPTISEGNDELNLGRLNISPYEFDGVTSKFDLTMSVSENDSNFSLHIDYCTAIFNQATMNRMLVHYKELLSSIIEDITQPINELTILKNEEKKQLLETFNNTEVTYPLDETILDLFSNQVKHSPNAIAVVYKGKELTYRNLDEKSNQLANYLRDQKVKVDTLVGICLERSLEMIVSILGVLKSGGAYVPIDPNYPKDRIDYMIEDTGIDLVLSSTISQEVLVNTPEVNVVLIDRDWEIISDFSTQKIGKVSTPSNLAYIIYTSGSTGKPKGVMIEHGNMFNLVNWSLSNFEDSLELGVLASTSINFDLSVFEIFTSLCSGSKLYLVDNLLSVLETQEISVSLINTVPSVLLSLLESGTIPDTVHTINLAGEPLAPSLVNRIYQESSVKTVYDLYGPSEATTYSTFTKRLINGVQTIGKPISNTQIYILDESNELLPIGVVGELCVGGKGVARGYLNRVDLTEEKFINNPFKEGDRIYKTGDLAKWLPDGSIEYVGRKDNQVKVRGYRIELGEIETVLAEVDYVLNSCVLAKEDVSGNKQLIGYVVTEEVFNKETIQEKLKESLPDYMVPMIWVELEKMPLTASGKLDRKSLPAPDGAMLSTKEYVAPRNETEAQLIIVWQDLLAVEKIGVYDDFFELGGHSLLVVQLIARLQKLGFHIEVKDIFSDATVAGISEKLASSSSVYEVPDNGIVSGVDRIIPSMIPLLNFEQEDIERVVENIPGGVSNIQDMYPLSSLQEGIYFHYLMSDKEQGDPYILPNLLSFKDKTKRNVFIEALQFVVNRHDVLRTCILSEGLPHAVQVVLREAPLHIEKLELDPSLDILAELEKLTIPVNLWMDVSKAPLLELKSIDDLDNDNYYLIINQHHLAIDHVGLEKIISEIEMYVSGQVENLPTPVLYRNFIGHAIHLQSTNNSETYFKGLFGGIDEPTYPFELSDIRGNGNGVKESSIILPEDLSKEIRNVSVTLGISPAVMFHAAYGIVVAKCSNRDYAIFGSLFSGRLQASLAAADSLGLFINTLPVILELNGTIVEYLNNVKKRLGELLPYEQTSLSNVQGWSGISNDMPLFSALLNYRHSSAPVSANSEEDGITVDLGITLIGGHERTNYPFTLDIDDYGTDFGMVAQIDGDVEPNRLLTYMEETLVELLKGLKTKEQLVVNKLAILPREESQLLETFNNTTVDYPLDKTVVDLFTNQVEKSPNAIAATFEGKKLTYKELDEKSNQIAHYLVAKGVQPDDLVGICLDRGLDMLVGVLGILKSGSAYVPIKPDFPIDRISHIVEDTKCSLLVTNKESQVVLNTLKNTNLIVLDDAFIISNYPITGLGLTYKATSLAYVIYTSGSTGLPKGAMIEHAGLLNHLLIMIDDLKMTKDSVVAFTAPFTFDISVWQLLSGLLSGGCIKIYSEEEILDIETFQSSLSAHQISHLQLVPSYVASLLESGEVVEGLSNLEYFLVTGEAATKSLLDKWFSLYPSVPVVNAYGPAEAADDITLHIMKESPKGLVVPIGKPVANMDVYVVDRFENLCPVGVVGELWTSGIGVGRGYLNREELTKEKFINNPFTSEGGRLYKTGDLGRWLPDGTLEFVGRTDHQVKIRGYRIELGEIENALSVVEGIHNSCVLAKKDVSGINRLVGYVVTGEKLDKEFVQEKLGDRLPDYMVPMIWVELDSMPLTANGKIDRKALPKPDLSDLATAEYVAPRTETEERLVKIWQNLLGVERIGVHDNFFELGGHSLLATRLVSTIRKEMEIEVSIRNIFRFTTIEEIASYLDYKERTLKEDKKEYSINIEI